MAFLNEPTTSYSKITSLALEKLRPKIIEQVMSSNAFYQSYKKQGNWNQGTTLTVSNQIPQPGEMISVGSETYQISTTDNTSGTVWISPTTDWTAPYHDSGGWQWQHDQIIAPPAEPPLSPEVLEQLMEMLKKGTVEAAPVEPARVPGPEKRPRRMIRIKRV